MVHATDQSEIKIVYPADFFKGVSGDQTRTSCAINDQIEAAEQDFYLKRMVLEDLHGVAEVHLYAQHQKKRVKKYLSKSDDWLALCRKITR